MITDIENIFLLLFLVLIFLFGLKRKDTNDTVDYVIDKNMSSALKGLACVMVLMGHYVTQNFCMEELPLGVTKMVQYLTANIALVWFMFFSGFGLSLKHLAMRDILRNWVDRIGKVYFPCFFVCFISLCLGLFRGGMAQFSLSPQILIKLSGIEDWYVMCIIMLYSIFYLSYYLAERMKIPISIVLFISLTFYYFIAFHLAGSSNAHYYRLVWAFYLGHIVAMRKSNTWLYSFATVAISMLSFINESGVMCFAFLIALALLYVVRLLNRQYYMVGRSCLLLGSVSYFYYLCHLRVAYPLTVNLFGTGSVIVWAVITFFISYVLQKSYQWMQSKFTMGQLWKDSFKTN